MSIQNARSISAFTFMINQLFGGGIVYLSFEFHEFMSAYVNRIQKRRCTGVQLEDAEALYTRATSSSVFAGSETSSPGHFKATTFFGTYTLTGFGSLEHLSPDDSWFFLYYNVLSSFGN